MPAAALAARSAEAADVVFDGETVRSLARGMATRAYRPPLGDLPASLAAISYDRYRDFRFAPSKAIWKADGLPFQLQLFHRGWLFRDKVEIFTVQDGRARPVAYTPDLFTFGAGPKVAAGPDLGFAGFRIHGAAGRFPGLDEIAAFLGSSYFRAVAKDGVYGLSARGLSIGSGEPNEEFPIFRSFWIERPAKAATSLTVHALLDSPSVAGAFRFVIVPGEATLFDVTASLFPRKDIANVGVAPLTSMYLFGVEQPRRFDDFRPEVHDSDGLLIANGQGERLWRPLSNPRVLQTSAFMDNGPKGFGLIQRRRDYGAYHDLEANYHRRPSLWVEPQAPLGRGHVGLVELATVTEGEDNIVAFWRPADRLRAGSENRFAYRLSWGPEPRPAPGLARATDWRNGHFGKPGRRRFLIDFEHPAANAGALKADVSASAGTAAQGMVQANDQTGGVRLVFDYDPGGARLSDLRARLTRGDRPCTETWTYRWVA